MKQLFTCSNCQHCSGSECALHSIKVNAGNEICPQHAFSSPDRAAIQYQFCRECPYFDPVGEQLCRSADQPAAQAFPVNCHRYRSLLADLKGRTRLNETADADASDSMVSIVNPDDSPEPVPQASKRRSASSRFPFLRYVNPFTLVCLLLLLVIVGVFFHIAPYHGANQETAVCLLLSLPCMGLVWGLIWGVMNPPVKSLHLLTALLLAANAARLSWSDADNLLHGVAVCGLCTVAVCLVSFGCAMLGTVITNAVFRIRKRSGRRA